VCVCVCFSVLGRGASQKGAGASERLSLCRGQGLRRDHQDVRRYEGLGLFAPPSALQTRALGLRARELMSARCRLDALVLGGLLLPGTSRGTCFRARRRTLFLGHVEPADARWSAYQAEGRRRLRPPRGGAHVRMALRCPWTRTWDRLILLLCCIMCCIASRPDTVSSRRPSYHGC